MNLSIFGFTLPAKKKIIYSLFQFILPKLAHAEEDSPSIIFLKQLLPLNLKVARKSFKSLRQTHLSPKGIVQSFYFPTEKQINITNIGYYLESTALQSIYLRR